MLIFLYGRNSYSLIQYVNELISRYQKKYPDSFNLHRFDLEEESPDEIKNVIKGVSFFEDVKFVIVKNPFAKAEAIEKVIKENNIAGEKDSVLLLYQTGEQEKFKDSKLFTLLAKLAQTKEFKSPTAQAATKFALNELAKSKVSIPRQALAKLTKETGPDLWRLKNELDKITGFIKQERKNSVSEEEIAGLVNFKVDYNIFNIVDAAFSNQGKAVILFENYFSDGGDPLYLLSMLAFQLKNMLIVRELLDPEADASHRYGAGKKLQYDQILKKTGMHPFFFKKNYEAAQKYSVGDLKKIFQRIVDFETALKTGQAEPENIFFKIFL